MIDWVSFIVVAVASIVSASIIVSLFALGTRLLAVADRNLLVEPVEFTDAITVITPAEAAKAAKRARKAEKRNPLSAARKRAATVAGYACFTVCGLGVLYGIYLIVPALHPS